MKNKRRKKKTNILIPILLVLVLLIMGAFGFAYYLYKDGNKTSEYYLCNDRPSLKVNDKDGNFKEFIRGTKVDVKKMTKKIDDITYRIFEYEGNTYYILDEYLKENRNDCVLETSMYTLRNIIATKDYDTYLIGDYVLKNTNVEIAGYHSLLSDGTVDYYKLSNGYYISNRYLDYEFYETALDSSIYKDTDYYNGGSPTEIEYYAKEDISFSNNRMPEKVKALYINAEAVPMTSSYIELAKETGINAFVVDIKDCYLDTQLAYESPAMRKYAPSTDNVVNTLDLYKQMMKMIKDNGFYLIGRITAFKDDAFAKDHPEEAILEDDGSLYYYGPVAWPSIYSRMVWEYDLALATEAVDEFGFNEIQFDYCRFPEYVDSSCDTHNRYNETASVAISEFLRYATEQLHNREVYVSADVFGEISGWTTDHYSAFVTNYGQFWCSISNIVDAISSMPYPDHFSGYAFSIPEPWAEPGLLMYRWGVATKYAQDMTYTPAKCRTWIQAQYSDTYDIDYTSSMIEDQIDGLTRAGVNDGYLTWNAASSLRAYRAYKNVLN